MNRSRPAIVGLFAFGTLAVSALLVPQVASAGPAASPLLTTTCSPAQIEAAIAVEAPRFSAYLDEHPERKASLEQFFQLPPDQRPAAVEEFRQHNPALARRIDERRNSPRADEIRAKIDTIAATCGNY